MIDEEDDICEWDAGKAYVGGEKVTYEGKQYEALWWTQGETPGESTVWSQVVEQGDDWVKNNIYVSGDQVSFDGSTYKAQWWTQRSEERRVGKECRSRRWREQSKTQRR